MRCPYTFSAPISSADCCGQGELPCIPQPWWLFTMSCDWDIPNSQAFVQSSSVSGTHHESERRNPRSQVGSLQPRVFQPGRCPQLRNLPLSLPDPMQALPGSLPISQDGDQHPQPQLSPGPCPPPQCPQTLSHWLGGVGGEKRRQAGKEKS